MTRRIALISEHASPLSVPGGVDSGGQNIYVGQLARRLVGMGYDVDIFTRRDSELLPEIAEWLTGIRIIHVPAGPPAYVRKGNEAAIRPRAAGGCKWLASQRRRAPAPLMVRFSYHERHFVAHASIRGC